MFSLASGIYQSYFVPQQISILLIGEEQTGKTCLLERIKVTQTSRKPARASTFACPAPKKYNAKRMVQEETVVASEQEQEERKPLSDGSSRSLEEIPLNDNSSARDQQQESFQEYNVKPGMKMLPLDKIRPTIGMNLAKIDLCGTNCRIWDVGGAMHDLWERYYEDAHAVIYCLSRDKCDKQLLEHTRLEIDDDVPFLVFYHDMNGTTNVEELTLDDLLPHYHNNLMQLMTGSARTGQGVREALEWLIPLAKRQLQLRQQLSVSVK